MREYAEHAYEGLCNTLEALGEFGESLVEVAKVLFVYFTLPIWIIPYAIIRTVKKGEKENA